MSESRRRARPNVLTDACAGCARTRLSTWTCARACVCARVNGCVSASTPPACVMRAFATTQHDGVAVCVRRKKRAACCDPTSLARQRCVEAPSVDDAAIRAGMQGRGRGCVRGRVRGRVSGRARGRGRLVWASANMHASARGWAHHPRLYSEQSLCLLYTSPSPRDGLLS
eukprot:6186411-Pleurochrysis_carterae.AAC.1